MGTQLTPDKLLKAEATMRHFPEGRIHGGSKQALQAIGAAKTVGPQVSPIAPRAAFSKGPSQK